MSRHLSQMEIDVFDKAVKQQFQGKSKLRGTTMLRTNVKGATIRFQIMNKGLAVQVFDSQEVVPMNIGYQKPIATMQDWVAPEYTPIFRQAKVNFDEKSELQECISGALGRRWDQLVLNELGSESIPTGRTVGTTNTAITAETLGHARSILMDEAVVEGQMLTAVLPAPWYRYLSKEEQIASMDYNTGKVAKTGNMPQVHGVNIVFVENRATMEGWNSAGKIGYVYAKSSIGVGENLSRRTEINYIPDKMSYLCNGFMSAGATVIEGTGIVKIQGT